MKPARALASVLLLCPALWAQVSPRLVRAVGEATVSVKPDQARVNIGITVQAATAQEAAALNASQMDALIARLKQALGAAGETRTINFSISPVYRSSAGQPPVLSGFSCSNTVEATTSELGRVGAIIDAAAQTGANNIAGLRFALKNEEPAKSEALSAASRQARAHAEAIATGLGARLGAVRSAQEGAVYTALPVDSRAATAATTPIETGFVQVRATVTVDFELLQ